MNRLAIEDPQLLRLSDAIAQRVGPQRFAVWFSNSTKFDLRNDSLEINVPNDFIGDWIDTHFSRNIQEATHEVFGSSLPVKFNVVPQLFEKGEGNSHTVVVPAEALSGGKIAARSAAGVTRTVPANSPIVGMSKPLLSSSVRSTPVAAGRSGSGSVAINAAINGAAKTLAATSKTLGGKSLSASDRSLSSGVFASAAVSSVLHDSRPGSQAVSALAGRGTTATLSTGPVYGDPQSATYAKSRLRHDLANYIVGASNQLAHSTANYVCEFPGGQYNPLFIHGTCGLGKTHLVQGLCRKFADAHPTKKWMYLTGEEFTNEFITSLRNNKIDQFRRKMRDLDLLVIDDVHFLSGKRSTQEEFLHTFNAIEASGRQVVMASDCHPKLIEDFGESLINRFISGMVVRIDPPNFAMRCEILRQTALKQQLLLSDEVVDWIAKRVTQNIRELEGALTRVKALSRLDGRAPGIEIVREALGDLDRQMVAPMRPENILDSVCTYFGLEHKELMSGRRQRTISLARSVAMYLVRKNSRLSFPEIAGKLGKRNHSTVISACRRIEKAVAKNELLAWESSIGDRSDEAQELIQRLEESARAGG